jgi:hypothetical protein
LLQSGAATLGLWARSQIVQRRSNGTLRITARAALSRESIHVLVAGPSFFPQSKGTMRYFVDGPAANKGGNIKAVAAGDRQRQTELRRPSIAADRDSMGSKSVPEIRLPYGVDELDSSVVTHADDLNLIRCFVRGCSHFVRRPTQYRRGTACPDHGIYCHHSRDRSTYTYDDVRRNIIASPELFAQRIVGHPFKYESDRFGGENSEDALSWNVFRSLQEAGKLADVVSLMTGMVHAEQPRLYLWGIRVDDDSFEPWDLLIAARERFERHLPVKRPLTEPDIGLHLPGKYLVLIEAKFTSPNPVYTRGPRKDAHSLTLDELLDIYRDSSLQILDYAKARGSHSILYQLWRNTVFAEWMALRDSAQTVAAHVNLVREAGVTDDARAFDALLADTKSSHFGQVTWETLQTRIPSDLPQLLSYLDNKTCYLAKAFR